MSIVNQCPLKSATNAAGPSTRTRRPIVTGTSVLAVTYKDGVMMTADTLGSYGSLSRFYNINRLRKVCDKTLCGFSGDISDMQTWVDMFEERRLEDYCIDDGSGINCEEIHSFVSRVMYQRRNKMDFLWNTVVVAGFDSNKKPFLGCVDKLGAPMTDPYIATGFGAHLALPLIREHWREGMSKDEAKQLLDNCMRVLYYRDCRTMNKIQCATVTENGVEVSEPYVMETKWDYDAFVKPKAGSDTGGSW
eukprot:g4954.t1